ncbi:hypothetical protein [Actinoplanes sp. NPDC020271]|uniref:hypothetical protein n=1 Tax=Actinoplanes sp. NPDC020271 TaxID=3363896 RepID=UPI00379F628A
MRLDVPWPVVWAGGTDDDPRMIRSWRVDGVRTAALAPDLVAAGIPSGIEVRDLGGEPRWTTACPEPRCLAFADGLLLSGHADGLRIWDAATGTPLRRVPDPGQVQQLIVVGTDVLTRDGRALVQRWRLPSGRPVGGPPLPAAHAVAGGRLGDGRRVLLAGLDGLALHDLDSHEQTWIVEPPRLGRVRSVALGTATGRDLVTVVDQKGSIQTFDVRTGAATAEPILAPPGRPEHARRRRLVVAGGILAVSDRWRVHLYDQATCAPAGPALPGPVAAPTLTVAGDRLLTSSAEDHCVAVWDLSRPAPGEPGHDERIVALALAGPGVVVSADSAGTLLARDTADGRLLHPPARTGVPHTHTVAAWTDGPSIVAATGAGTPDHRDPLVRLLDLATGEPYRPPIDTGQRVVCRLAVTGPELITEYGWLRKWLIRDGSLRDAWIPPPGPAATGFGVGTRDGRDVVVTCVPGLRFEVHDVGDLSAGPVVVPAGPDDVMLAVSGPHIVTRGRVLDTAGRTIAAGVRRLADATLAAVRVWPQAYLAHEDGSISLTDLLTGADLAPPVTLPSRPISLVTAADGDLLVGYGSDVARLRPHPISSNP